LIAALCMAYPALDPRELPAMRADTATVLINGRVGLMDRVRATQGAPGGPQTRPGGIGWGEARPKGAGAVAVPVRGLEGLKSFLAAYGD
jgi:hypothetical protein